LKHQSSAAGGLKIEDFLQIEEIHNYTNVSQTLQAYIDKMQGAGKKKPAAEGEGGEEGEAEAAEVGPIGFVADLIADQKIFEWAGIGFGEIETYRILKSLKQLSKESGAGYVRFFGLINGTEKDYYVAEGTLEGGDGEGGEGGDNKPADQEARGSGVNKFVYWVTDSVLEKWTKLPDLSPADIKASRQIKVMLTGDLERPIFTNPFFFGKEKHYLRAQIARIIHSTSIVPKGLHKVVEDNDREIEDFVPEDGAEAPLPTVHTLSKVEGWVHYTPNILFNGRLSHMDPENLPDDADPEVVKKQIEAKDPYEKRLKPIALDRAVRVGGASKQLTQSPWAIKLLGDTQDYFNPVKPTKKVNNGIVVVRSLQWPGAYTLFQGGRTLSIYIGNGHKYEGGLPQGGYYPVFPPKIMDDPKEFTEQPEPTPLTEPIAEQKPAEGDGEPKPEGDGGDDE
jgi:radial spoke head protein 4/6